ncbi:hypothetical protein LCGC14_2564790 [marine sediment metagenome]|uniref:Uncharacterized protein n=1 Tax=marine sediment metagenome TaxID=412755 RepID=A0A0F9CV61_9ZZZZ
MDRAELLATRGGIMFNELDKYLADRGVHGGKYLSGHNRTDGQQEREFINLDRAQRFQWSGNAYAAETLKPLLDFAEMGVDPDPLSFPDASSAAVKLKEYGYQAWAALRLLLAIAGEPGICKGCGRPIFWIQRKPYSTAGVIHFVDCPKRDDFRKKKKQ